MLPYRSIHVAAKSGNVPHLIGMAGEGKSDAIAAMAFKWDNASQFYTLFLAQNDPITLGTGIPMRNEEDGTFTLVGHDQLQAIVSDPKAWLFADELADGDMDQQRAFSPIVLNKSIWGMPVQCTIVCASNPPEEGANELDTRLANRLQHFEWSMASSDFVDGLTKGWDVVMGAAPVLPRDWAKGIADEEAMVAKFISQFPQRFKSRDTKTSNFPAFATPRSWQKFACRYLAAGKAAGLSKAHLQLGLEGCIGKGVAAEYVLWARHDGLDVRAIIADPTKLKDYLDPKTSPATVDAIFDAVNTYTAEGTITGEECGSFYASATKYGFEPDLIMRHVRKVTEKLPRKVREAIVNEIAVRAGQDVRGDA